MKTIPPARAIPPLSPVQRAAVEHGDGPLLIIAGAGTGKTFVITHRIAHLIATKRARPHEILALTFSEKAASEMEERVDLLTPYGYTDVAILTFHAFGDRLLREFGMRIGLSPDFRVLSFPEQVIFFKRHLFDFPLPSFRPLGNPFKHIEAILKHISRAKDEDISPESYLAYADKALAEGNPSLIQEATLQKELALTYRMYQDLLAREGSLDFGDQVFLALRLLREIPSVSTNLPYKYILVDEFQDTNYAQFQLIQHLALQGAHLTVVGDDDQSIYKFRGAAISNIQRFSKIYQTADRIVLTENFRSRQEILDAAYRLIQHNNPNRLETIEKIDKHLYAATAKTSTVSNPVIPLQFDTLSAEADHVASVISEGVSRGEPYNDFAILVRSNSLAEPYIRALNVRNIPSRFTGNRGLFSRPDIRMLISFMRAVVDRNDSRSLYFLLCSELYRFPIQLLSEQMVIAKRKNQSLYHVLQETIDAGCDNEEAVATFQKLAADLTYFLNRSREVDAGATLYEFIRASGLLSRLSGNPTQENDAAIQNIARFFGQIKQISQWTKTPFLPDVTASLDLLLSAGEDPPAKEADLSDDAVHILTIHRAKGLEFKTVFMVGLAEGTFPTRNRGESLSLPSALIPEEIPEGHPHTEEERRLFYVGMTRAKERLFLTSAQDVGGARLRKLSSFVMEALDLPLSAIRAIASSPLDAIAREDATPARGTSPAGHGAPARVSPLAGVVPLTLSFYQIDDYLTCPLKYKYIHVLRVPIYPSHAMVYGALMHQAVASYLTARRGNVPCEEHAPNKSGNAFSLDDLMRVMEKGWKSEGYLSREHEELRMAAGRQALQRFYEEEEKSNRGPTFVEKDFSFLFEGEGSPRKVRIKGRWDRVDEDPDGAATIIDYKTSAVNDQKEADKKARESLQLTLYAWAYQVRTSVLPKQVMLYFLDSGLVGTDVKEEKDIDKIKEKVSLVAKGILSEDFSARPTYIACRYCPYQEICPYTASTDRD